MTIDKLGSVDPISNINKTEKSGKISKTPVSDSVSVSEEARKQAALQLISKEVNNTPEIRENRVEEVKKKLENPDYIDNTVINSVADSILDIFGV